MIDWWLVSVSALWILGLSIVLAAFSYHDWLRQETGRSWKELRSSPSWQLPFSAGLLLFCLGMGFGRTVSWWERALWGLLSCSFAWQAATAALELGRRSRRGHADQANATGSNGRSPDTVSPVGGSTGQAQHGLPVATLGLRGVRTALH
jgi:hypothetical protein